ncbi:MAG: hypothetical protein ACYTFA_00525 [Planctomycetota bacterium]|jgi:hypothetical protein
MPAVVFDRANRELRTVRFHFADKREAVVRIRWEKGIKCGVEIEPKRPLGHILWRKSEPEPFRAPAGCAGIIERRPLDTDSGKYTEGTSVMLLSLRR